MITYILIIVIGLISYQCFSNYSLKYKLAFYPYGVKNKKEYTRFITSIFVHGDWMHLLFNLFVLYSFGLSMESEFREFSFERYGTEIFGMAHFLIIFLLAGIAGDIPDTLTKSNNPNYYSLGASGAISGLLFAFIVMHPFADLIVFIGVPLPLKAWLYGLVYIGFSIYADKKGGDNINHLAHVGGALAGVIYVLFIFPGILLK